MNNHTEGGPKVSSDKRAALFIDFRNVFRGRYFSKNLLKSRQDSKFAVGKIIKTSWQVK